MTKKSLYLSLREEDAKFLDQVAAAQRRTRANMGEYALLKGLEVIEKEIEYENLEK